MIRSPAARISSLLGKLPDTLEETYAEIFKTEDGLCPLSLHKLQLHAVATERT